MSLVGRLEDLALSDIFQILSIGRKTGTLTIQSDKGCAFIVFKKGLVVKAETSLLKETIGHDLLNAKIMKENVLSIALEVKKQLPQKPIAEIFLELGSVTKEVLDKLAKKRIEKVVYHILLMNQGAFRFELDNVEAGSTLDIQDVGWEVSKGISAEYLLMEGARVQDEQGQTETLADISGEEAAGEREGWEEEWGGGAPAKERKDISALRSLTQELRFPNSTSEITLLILRFASDMFQRGVLFMVGSNEIIGLGQFGINIENADEKIRETVLQFDKSAFIKGIINQGQSYKGTMAKDPVTEFLIAEIGGNWPQEVVFFPIIAEGKVVALLYCDNLPDEEAFPETEGLDIFISQAGMALEKSLLQKKLQEMQNREKQ